MSRVIVPVMHSPPKPLSKSRHGCLLGCLGQLIKYFALGMVLVLGITAAFKPWGFFLGGKFHVIPSWQGWGILHAKNGNYVVRVDMNTNIQGRRSSDLRGTAYLCTPHGERFRLTLTGNMGKHLHLSTDGEAIHLGMSYMPYGSSFSGDTRPNLELRGHWQNPNLVMDDNGSISRAFQPDGSVYRGHDGSRPYPGDIVPITLSQGPSSDFEAACAANRR
jgi:hypothetical protein